MYLFVDSSPLLLGDDYDDLVLSSSLDDDSHLLTITTPDDDVCPCDDTMMNAGPSCCAFFG